MYDGVSHPKNVERDTPNIVEVTLALLLKAAGGGT
jgi:hypothetical protein